MHIYLCTRVRACVCVHAIVYIVRACVHVGVHVCVHVCMCVYMCACVCVCFLVYVRVSGICVGYVHARVAELMASLPPQSRRFKTDAKV